MSEKPFDRLRCGSIVPTLLHDSSGDVTYELISKIGEGYFGRCYKIMNDINLQYRVCKVISKRSSAYSKAQSEIAIHRKLIHSNIVTFHHHFYDEMNVYLIIEYCPKQTLKELHISRQSITEYECRHYMYQIVKGMQYIHARNIIHCDIKLSNIFLTNTLQVKIGDFGLAVEIKNGVLPKSRLSGTPMFMAPEVVNRSFFSGKADVWSAGCVMYTLLTGFTPFKSVHVKNVYAHIRLGNYVIPVGMCKQAADMLKAMLTLSTAHRPTSTQLMDFEFLKFRPISKILPEHLFKISPKILSFDSLHSMNLDIPLSEKHIFFPNKSMQFFQSKVRKTKRRNSI